MADACSAVRANPVRHPIVPWGVEPGGRSEVIICCGIASLIRPYTILYRNVIRGARAAFLARSVVVIPPSAARATAAKKGSNR